MNKSKGGKENNVSNFMCFYFIAEIILGARMRKLIDCDCYDPGHAIIIEYNEESEEYYFWFQVKNYMGFWKRLAAAVKYVFTNKNLGWDCCILDKEKAEDLSNFLSSRVW